VDLASTPMDLPNVDALAALVADGDVLVLSGAGLSTVSGTRSRTTGSRRSARLLPPTASA
jgi:hypothetical protein